MHGPTEFSPQSELCISEIEYLQVAGEDDAKENTFLEKKGVSFGNTALKSSFLFFQFRKVGILFL